MHPFIESNDLLDDPPRMRRRLRDTGYLFVRSLLPREEVLAVRDRVLKFCDDAGWLRRGTRHQDGLTDREPIREGDDLWRPVYARLQAEEPFHRLKLHPAVHQLMERLFEEPVFALPATIGRIAFPRDNPHGTQPHQDWIYVRGSMEIISCWAPLGDIPREVGGLKVLAGSHKAGLLAPRPAEGPGGHTVDVDPELSWHQSEFEAGDLLLFSALTVHAAAENHTPDRLRLSMDFRYAGESHTINESWLKPHYHWLGDDFSWDALDQNWRDTPTARYWERLSRLKAAPAQEMPGW